MRRVYLKNNLTEEEHKLTEAWIEALRSGNYKQGTGVLRDVRREGFYYCCLGVLCTIDPNIELDVAKGDFTYKGKKEYHVLFPEYSSVLKSYLSEAKYKYARRLTYLNDDDVPFSKIAKLLELDLAGKLTAKTYKEVLK